MKYLVECDLKPTENKGVLLKSLKAFFPDADFKVKDDIIVGESDLNELREISKRQESEVPLAQLDECGQVSLDKLAMFAGAVALNDEFPLGCVRIKMLI